MEEPKTETSDIAQQEPQEPSNKAFRKPLSLSLTQIHRYIIIVAIAVFAALLVAVAFVVPIVDWKTRNKSDEPQTQFVLKGYQVTDYHNKHTDGSYDTSKYVRTGQTYTYTAKNLTGTDLQTLFTQISSGDTIILDGSEGVFHLTTANLTKGGITIKGKNNAILDFSDTYGEITKDDVDAAVAICLERFKTIKLIICTISIPHSSSSSPSVLCQSL